MAKSKSKEISNDTLLSSDLSFDGSIHTEEVVLIQGVVEGSVDSTVEVYVSKNATVKANVHAKTVVTYGSIHGDIHAKDTVEIYDSAKISGNVRAKHVLMQRGAVLRGEYIVGQAEDAGVTTSR